MKVTNEILIIFSKGDNQEINNRPGWVSNFGRVLKLYLDQVNQSDNRIRLVDDEEISSLDNYADNALLFPVISDEFLENKLCVFGIEEFLDEARNDFKINLDPTDRVFKIRRHPVNENILPANVIDLPNYDFFSTDHFTGKTEGYGMTPEFGKSLQFRFWNKMTDVVYDAAMALKQVMGAQAGGELMNQKLKTVYLAETGEDLTDTRDHVKRDLIRHGYVVLPRRMKINDGTLKERIRKDVAASDLSIQLVGNEYGVVPDQEESSVTEIQNEVIDDYAKSIISKATRNKFKRLIWFSIDEEEVVVRQKNLVDTIVHQTSSSEDVEILETPVEELRHTIRKRLNQAQASSPGPDETHEENTIYLMADQPDSKELTQLVSILEKRNFKVLQNTAVADSIGMLRDHERKLSTCDSFLILHETRDKEWLNSKLRDLIKSPGLGRREPIKARAVLNVSGEVDRQLLRDSGASLIEILEGKLQVGSLSPFFAQFETTI